MLGRPRVLARRCCRMLGAILALVGALTVALPPALADAPAAGPPVAAPPLDYGVPGGHFYTQANGQPLGKSGVGFLLGDDGGIGFWSGFQALGGVDLLGYPISGRFQEGAFVEQATQRAILQWQPKLGGLVLSNVFDQLHDAGKDAWLQSTYQVPPPVKLDEKGQTFAQVEKRRLALLDGNAAIKAKYLAASDAVTLYGLPTSGPVDFGPMVALRCQRVTFQFWKVDRPWAKAGTVTLVNGGDVAKAAGMVPATVASPAAPPVLDGQAAATPWSGWWWPASLQPFTPPYLFSDNGPLAKYDAYIAKGGAPSPDTKGWERQHITFNDPTLFWAGHCNGWAAAALLEPEPTTPVTARGVTFSVADQKGLLSDYHFADTPVWEYGSTAEALKPQDFQRMVVQWLGQKHLGFVIDDYTTSDQIESYPVYRFHLVYIPDPLDPNKTHVQLTLWMASYHVDANVVGMQPYPDANGQRFDYFITGPKDNPTGGEWEGVSLQGKQGHPRFIWYPNPKVRNVGRTLTDPALNYATILAILGRPAQPTGTFGPLQATPPAAAGAREIPWTGD